jgi:dUTP pyrophosphatase
MILSPSILLPIIEDREIISGLDERELSTPEGAGFDLCVKSVSRMFGAGSLLIKTRHTSDSQEISPQFDDGIIHLDGNSSYLLTTKEKFKLDNDMLAVFHPRSTLFRSGVIFQSGVAPFGYEGPMTFMIHVANPLGFTIQIGARFAHVNIITVLGGSSAYKGQWQNGRITTTVSENQI